jgi:hypothetical protein
MDNAFFGVNNEALDETEMVVSNSGGGENDEQGRLT